MQIDRTALFRHAARAVYLGLIVVSVALLAVPAWRVGTGQLVFVGFLLLGFLAEIPRMWHDAQRRKTDPQLYAQAREVEGPGPKDPLARAAYFAAFLAALVSMYSMLSI
jgi:hypothetical protein